MQWLCLRLSGSDGITQAPKLRSCTFLLHGACSSAFGGLHQLVNGPNLREEQHSSAAQIQLNCALNGEISQQAPSVETQGNWVEVKPAPQAAAQKLVTAGNPPPPPHLTA